MFDLNDAELPRGSDLIPDGSFAKLTMTLRPGGVDGQGDADRGLLKPTTTAGSNVLMLDGEFTILAGPHARRKFWQMFTVAGGKVDEKGVSIGLKISKGILRAMLDSALGLDPQDMSEEARGKRVLRGFVDLSGIIFAAKIRVEPASGPRYGDSNRLDRVVLPNEPEWQRIMAGEVVPASPSRRSVKAAPAAAATPPAWASQPTQPTAAAPSVPAPAWRNEVAAAPSAPSTPPPAQVATPGTGGPPWLKG